VNVFETKIICKTFQGLEQVLADELTALNAKNVEIIKRAVVCDYDKELLYRCNLELRTCLKVLVPLFEFESNSPEDLYGFAILGCGVDRIIGICAGRGDFLTQ